jgi:uncharacterized protein YgbK (DUF1537 family)
MRLGIIADDFTGASDVANAVSSSGLATQLVIGAQAAVDPGADAAVIALKSRSIPPGEAVRLSRAALGQLRRAGAERIFFKYCSTFDSTPQGNIGPVADALAEELGVGAVAVCPAFPETGRTVYQGHLFVGDRLLSETGLARHPLNPMTDPDLVRWLGRQTPSSVGLLPHARVAAGAKAVKTALGLASERFVVTDALSDADLDVLGEALRDAPLATGASGLAAGIARALAHGETTTPQRPFQGLRGPAVLLAGSCSSATLAQVERYRGPAFRLDVARLLDDPTSLEEARTFVRANLAGSPLIYSSAPADQVAALQARYGAERVAGDTEAAFQTLARTAVAAGAERIVSAGGETSGAIVAALGLTAFDLGPQIAPGVPGLRSRAPALAVALKSGNFGGPDFFAAALDALGSGG